MLEVDSLVVGAGVVGLATARAIARMGRTVAIVEGHGSFGRELSSRHSEVLHAGFYYRPGSLKARTCVRGRYLLETFCEEHGIGLRRVGKLVVATDEGQVATLSHLYSRGRANGVEGLELLDREVLQQDEPALRAMKALYSSQTGIVDSHGVMSALEREAIGFGVVAAYRTPFLSGTFKPGGMVCKVGGREPAQIRARMLINAAGLMAPSVASRIEGLPPSSIPKLWFAKGSYFHVRQPIPFSHLIYPVPDDGGLGIHLTMDLGGRHRVGPDTEWVAIPDFKVESHRAEQFYAAVRRYWPDLRDGALVPDSASVRPKLHGPEGEESDFLIQTERNHGVPGVVNLYGIESPGLTASMALAEIVSSLH